MDATVEKALEKWPNVPHCYGWLALDARGVWRMRNESAQRQNLPGEKIFHPALIEFINRNYTHDERGQWYFQNGPQRVYVNLEAAPYIAHTEPNEQFILHTGQRMHDINAVWLSESGRLFLQNDDKLALLDDRDMAQCMAQLQVDGRPVTDDQLLKWLDIPDKIEAMSLQWQGRNVPVKSIADDAVSEYFHFVPAPQRIE